MTQNGVNSGLPNLPALQTEWQLDESTITLSAIGWESVVKSDPSRMSLTFVNGGAGKLVVTPFPNDIASIGFNINPDTDRTFTVYDFGSMVSLEWYCLSTGAPIPLQVITQAIRKKGIRRCV